MLHVARMCLTNLGRLGADGIQHVDWLFQMLDEIFIVFHHSGAQSPA